MYFVSQLVNAALGLAVIAVLTRAFSVTDFGTYSFIVSVILFLSIFFDFGLSSSGTRLIAFADVEAAFRRRTAAIILSSFAVGLLFAGVFASISFLVDPVFKTSVGHILLLTAPLMIVFPMQEVVIAICRGSNRIEFLSLFTILPRILYLGLLGLVMYRGPINITFAVVTMLIGILLSILTAVLHFKPQLAKLSREFSLLKKEIREFGLDIYYGRIIDGLTNGVDRMTIAFFHSVVPLGFYTIASMMVSPISMFSRSIGVSAYKRFTEVQFISGKILFGNLLWCVAGSVALVLACEVLIPVFFTNKYAPALDVLPWLALGGALAALNVPYTTFLSAQRQGKAIKVMSITTSSLNLLLNLILIPFYSLHGAAIALICSYGLNFAMNLYYYYSYRKAVEHANS